MPMSARRRAGASLTPSPVIATVWPCARSASTTWSLVSGLLRATISSCASCRSASGRARASRRGRRRRRRSASPSTIPTSRAIASAVSPWSPVMTMMRIPARWQRATASATSARGGSASAASPTNVRCDSTRSRSPSSTSGDRRSAKPSTRRPRPRIALERRRDRRAGRRRSSGGRRLCARTPCSARAAPAARLWRGTRARRPAPSSSVSSA